MRIKDDEDLKRHLNELLVAREGLAQQLPKLSPAQRWELTSAIAELDGYLTLSVPTDVVH